MYLDSIRSGVDDDAILFRPPPLEVAKGEYPMGTILYNKEKRGIFGIRESEMIQHAAVFGRSGSGKTNSVYVLIGNLLKNNKPFLIFDWKRNYRALISEPSDRRINIYTVGRSLSPLCFNPLIPPPGTEPTAWLKKLIEIIAKATFVGDGVGFLLQQGTDKLYRQCGVYAGSVKRYPTMADLLKVMQEMSVKGRAANWMASTQRALAALCFGAMGDVLNTQSNTSLAELLEKNVVLELDSLTSTDKVFFIESLLLWIHHYRLTQQGQRDKFKHAIILEEAHHIIAKQQTGSQETITDLLLREIRELGEAIILIDQHPSQISLPALGNTYTTLTLNLKSREDVNAASSYLLFKDDDKRKLGQLEVGQAVVKLQGRWTQPFLIEVPHIQLKHKVVTDEEIRLHMQGGSGDSIRKQPSQTVSAEIPHDSGPGKKEVETALSDIEKAFLKDVQLQPLSGVVERYKRLSLSRRKGNEIKENLCRRKMIKPVEISTSTGKVVLLECMDLRQRRIKGQPYCIQRNPGVVHEYWREKIAAHYQKHGFEVTREKKIPGDGYIDLFVQKGQVSIAIEIETGKSEIKHNITKALQAGYSHIRVLGTGRNAVQKIQAAVSSLEPADADRVTVGVCAGEISQ